VIKLFWRTAFGLFSSSMMNNTDITIINTGYATTSEEDMEGLALMKHGLQGTFRNQFDRFRFQMYEHVVAENGGLEDMRDKTLLETGCGRGGGLNYLANLMRPRYAIGVDASRSNIEYCKQHWPRGSHVQCDFLVADAENLSLSVPRLSIDYVVDIESFFYYTDKHAYLREVHSVLKEDGKLFLAFFIQRTRLEEIHGYLRQYFDIQKEEDITDNAIHSLRLDTQRISRFADQ
jgi:ubiquinone/menaquinone biosynthesis C-methylase UbiE